VKNSACFLRSIFSLWLRISGLGSDEVCVRSATRVPDAYHDIIADMSGALYDTVSRPETAANVDSTGQNKSRHAVKRDGSL
jgi:hypothetical protein